MSDELENDFTLACERAITECHALGYSPTVWERMVHEHGAREAAKRLVHGGDIQSGLVRLLRMGRADLTIEVAVCDPHWHDLFTDLDREAAEWRLSQARLAR